MAVRNISAIGRTKPIPIYVWIPPANSATHKIEVSDGTTDWDITNIVLKGEFKMGITNTIGDFSFTIDNSNETYTGLFSLYDSLNIYIDYGTTATTLRLKGVIEKVLKENNKLTISGKGPALKVLFKNVTYATTDMARSTILTNIIEKYFNGFITTTNIESDTGTTTVNYLDKPFWEIVEELCGQGSFDAYIDKTFDFHYFAIASRSNTTEAVVHGYNLIDTKAFADDASNIYNKVKVYGKRFDSYPLLYTSQDATSQTAYKVRELRIDDSSIDTTTAAKARADFELANAKDPPTVGIVTSLILPTIAPGERIRVSDPQNGISPGYYNVFEFKHIFDNDKPPMTELILQKEQNTLATILKKRISFESAVISTENPTEKDFSKIYDFETDSGTHTNTQIVGGVLKTDGGSLGNWVSDTLTLDTNLSTLHLTLKGIGGNYITIQVSVNGGTTYHNLFAQGEVTPLTITAPIARLIKFKVLFTNSGAELNTMAVFYNVE